ncbi:MAG: hypothetical protein BZ138_08155 [Methanosphaera sp. rholeuAM270]|nr:MAG: hypothetical protein BZ138_08155 [Methanosphaera sp. rholeuAM270]
MDNKNILINEDFTDRDEKYYVTFLSPKNKIVEIHNISKIILERTGPDIVQLKIKYGDNKTAIYYYVNEFITLLDSFDIGLE